MKIEAKYYVIVSLTSQSIGRGVYRNPCAFLLFRGKLQKISPVLLHIYICTYIHCRKLYLGETLCMHAIEVYLISYRMQKSEKTNWSDFCTKPQRIGQCLIIITGHSYLKVLENSLQSGLLRIKLILNNKTSLQNNRRQNVSRPKEIRHTLLVIDI